ncbi:MAG: hypothetical protein ACRCTQ_07040 [Brevinemataceae bacterium]
MKKYILLLLLILVSPMMAQENKQTSLPKFAYINPSIKFYFTLGLPLGFGLLFAPEIRSSINNNVLHVLNFDIKYIGIDVSPTAVECSGIGVNFQYSIGSILASGGRFYVDLIGVGYNLGIMESQRPYLTVNTIGFQNTLSNGFYWGIRTYLTLMKDRRETDRWRTGFGAYLAIGYDFGKKINPKDYESRMR